MLFNFGSFSDWLQGIWEFLGTEIMFEQDNLNYLHTSYTILEIQWEHLLQQIHIEPSFIFEISN